ncbi:hypothetical protein [Nostoc sp. DedQUE09]|uniref:hypothetical protein n=1 Tax=Nostoc sp. DedQUE09 TaxID=3075394 RepID=UPI002AD43C44|nr:hypothetical protein [Nostoc sp. DedQUE09]MDZ7952291.1 hypothetical protein [Nostoc sp. DedQUE09]
MAKVYLSYIKSIDEQDPRGGDNNDEIYYLVEGGSRKNTVSNSFDAGEDFDYGFPGKLLENDPATKSDPLFFTLWEDDPSGDDKFTSIRQTFGSDPGTIKDGGIYFDGTPGYYGFTFSGNGGNYTLEFSVT